MIPTIVPNYHVILIHFPLALLAVGMIIEIFSFLWRRTPFHQAGRWMILLGTLGMAPAATSGIYALHDVATHGTDAASWADVKQASGFSDADWHQAYQHVFFTSVATGIALIVVVSWLGGTERWRRAFYYPGLIVLIAAWIMLGVGAYRGGEMIFRQGFGVVGRQSTELETQPNPLMSKRDEIERAISPMQWHLIGAGLVVAFAAGALGTGLRRSALAHEVLLERPPIPEPIENPNDPSSSRISIVGALYNPARARIVSDIPASLPVARLWLVGAILALIVVFLGFYEGGYLVWPHVLDIQKVHDSLSNTRVAGSRREGLHIVCGAVILLLLCFLSLFARIVPRNRMVLAVFSLVLAFVIAAQIWLGILLLYDNPTGPLMHFQ